MAIGFVYGLLPGTSTNILRHQTTIPEKSMSFLLLNGKVRLKNLLKQAIVKLVGNIFRNYQVV